jgi:hypothetical protein
MSTLKILFSGMQASALILVSAIPLATLHAQSTPAPASTAPASPSLQEQLEAQYPLAKMTANGGCTVTNPDTAVAVQKPGIGALPQRGSNTMCAAHYRNGSITKTGFKCTYYLNMTKQSLVTLQKGERVFPTKFEVGKDEIKVAFGYCSGDPGQAVPYTGQVVIEFPKDSLKGLSVPQVEDKIAEVFVADNGGNQQGQGGQDQNSPQNGQQDQNPAPQENQPSACNPEISQTPDQIVASCGNPASQAKGAGTKQIYFYNQPKLKITFVDGKVADVE